MQHGVQSTFNSSCTFWVPPWPQIIHISFCIPPKLVFLHLLPDTDGCNTSPIRMPQTPAANDIPAIIVMTSPSSQARASEQNVDLCPFFSSSPRHNGLFPLSTHDEWLGCVVCRKIFAAKKDGDDRCISVSTPHYSPHGDYLQSPPLTRTHLIGPLVPRRNITTDVPPGIHDLRRGGRASLIACKT